MSQILVIEDEAPIIEFLGRGLSFKGYHVTLARTGEDGLATMDERPPHLILLDLMLPGMDGLDVCRTVRSRTRAPIIVLTARDSTDSKVAALDAGADDYVVKPFSFAEILARIRAHLRREGVVSHQVVRVGPLVLDPASRRVQSGDRRVELTPREFDLLELLMRNAGQVVPRALIQERIWGYEWESDSDPVKVYVSYLRRKLETCGERDAIRAVRGVGYCLQT
ncbi:MAG: response regulator transcription factor [Hyphomicrobiales bacterium]